MIFRLCVVYNKHEMVKIGNQTREKSHILSQVLEKFAVDCICEVVILKLYAVYNKHEMIKICNQTREKSHA